MACTEVSHEIHESRLPTLFPGNMLASNPSGSFSKEHPSQSTTMIQAATDEDGLQQPQTTLTRAWEFSLPEDQGSPTVRETYTPDVLPSQAMPRNTPETRRYGQSLVTSNEDTLLNTYRCKCEGFTREEVPIRQWHEEILRSDGDSQRTLVRKAILDAMVPSINQQRFLPEDQLKKMLSPATIELFLSSNSCTPSYELLYQDGRKIAENYLKVFAILVLISKAASIKEFVNAGCTDACLPLSVVSTNDTVTLQSSFSLQATLNSLSWPASVFRRFEIVQWSFLAPTITIHPNLHVGQCQRFNKELILPFIWADRFKSSGFSKVYRVKIHESHLDWLQPKELESPRFAIKELHTNRKDVFEREVEALSLMGRCKHPHIVRLQAAFQHQDKYYLIFPWAEGDLARFWSLNPDPAPTLTTFQWMVKQMQGIAHALSVIHNLEPREQPNNRYYGRHGDLKPENILWFQDSKDTPKLQLCDFGLANFYSTQDEAFVQASKAAYTHTYRPPECDMSSGTISQSSDIWSLGCIFLESIIWVLCSARALKKFKDDRYERTEDGIDYYSFFQTQPSNGMGNHTISMSPAVKDWIGRLRQSQNANRYTNRFLDMVVERMLVIEDPNVKNPRSRASAAAIAYILADLDKDLSANQSADLPAACWLSEQSDDWNPRDTLGDLDKMIEYNTTPSRKRKQFVVDLSNTAEARQLSKIRRRPDFEALDKVARRLACPFFKNDPKKFGLSRACSGPGWTEFHRVKEHITRCHTPDNLKSPWICTRCCENFKSEDTLILHQRGKERCPVNEEETMDGFINLDQAINLRSRKKKTADMTDEEKWYEAYRILFPSQDSAKYPIPYYNEENTTSSSLTTLTTQSSGSLSEYKQYVQRPLNDDEQKELEQGLGSALGIVNPDMCKIFAEKLREFQLKELQRFDNRAQGTYAIPEHEVSHKPAGVPSNDLGGFFPEGVDSTTLENWPSLDMAHGDDSWTFMDNPQ
ncbi:hypothetical protein HD806DRAFT_481656 [Xylariaceae sp. AK1471]|nr:hypothetical protein HD806DRAFT_481656 [Xylariaceae sp. AK1471]